MSDTLNFTPAYRGNNVILFLVRHAEAVQAGVDLPDSRRFLTKAGIKSTKNLALRLKKLFTQPEIIVCGPSVRTMQTAKLLHKCFPGSRLLRDKSMGLFSDAGSVVTMIKKHMGTGSIMLIGHEPQLSDLMEILIQNSRGFHFSKSSAVILQLSLTLSRCKFLGYQHPNYCLIKPEVTAANRDAPTHLTSGYTRLIQSQQRSVASLLKKAANARVSASVFHDLRVALRRFKVLTGICSQMSTEKHPENLLRPVGGLIKKLSKIRDIDESIACFEAGLGTSVAFRKKILTHLRQLRYVELVKIKRSVKKFSRNVTLLYNVCTSVLPESSAKARPTTFLKFFLKQARRHEMKVRKLLLNPDINSLKKLHRLRISVKKWRYALELNDKIAGQIGNPLIARLKNYQTLLGSIHNLTMFSQFLSKKIFDEQEIRQLHKICSKKIEKLILEFKKLLGTQPL